MNITLWVFSVILSVLLIGSISFADAVVPDKPTGFTAEIVGIPDSRTNPDFVTIKLGWTDSQSTFSSITGYRVEYKTHQNRVDEWHVYGIFDREPQLANYEAAVNFTGLVGAKFDFRVAAINSDGVGAYSDEINNFLAAREPGKVENLKLRFDNDNEVMHLTWTAPSRDGGSPITGYVVETSHPRTAPFLQNTYSSTTMSHSLETKSVNRFVFSVIPINSIGNGDPNSKSIIPALIPDAPTNLQAQQDGSGKIKLTWDTSSDGFIVDYIIEYRSGGPWKTFNDGTSTENSIIVDNLRNAVGYQFRVKAVNVNGEGIFSNSAYATTYAYLKPIDWLITTPGYDFVGLNWNAPPSDTTVTDYKIQYSVVGGGNWEDFDDAISTSTTAIVTGLSPGTKYSFAVWPVNSFQPNGPGDKVPEEFSAQKIAYKIINNAYATTLDKPQGLSSEQTPIEQIGLGNSETEQNTPSLPNAPTNLAAIPSDSQVELSWDIPYDGGSPITDYLIQYTSDSTWITWNDYTGTSATITELVNDTLYTFRVSAINDIGISDSYAEISATPIQSEEKQDDPVPIEQEQSEEKQEKPQDDPIPVEQKPVEQETTSQDDPVPVEQEKPQDDPVPIEQEQSEEKQEKPQDDPVKESEIPKPIEQEKPITSNTLTITAYSDTNNNGIQDIDESGIYGVMIMLVDSNGNYQTVYTNSSGIYKFEDVEPQNYIIYGYYDSKIVSIMIDDLQDVYLAFS